MLFRSLCLLVVLLFSLESLAQKLRSYALLIGINQYKPSEPEAASGSRGFGNLDGAVNDALAFKMLLSARFGFRPANVQVLTDAQATGEQTRKALLATLQKAKPGEQVLVYYAGHGSQVRNPASPEPDKMDETIVPVDAWRGNLDGKLYDIRDKEIARIVYPFAKSGVLVTLIFDSCHSGSATRAASGRLGKMRKAEPSGVVLNDSTAVPPLEEVGVLTLTAAQDFQAAQEYYDAKGNPHGAFTYALMQALRQAGRYESVQSLFLRTRAQLKLFGLKQEPVLLSNEGRRQQPLLRAWQADGEAEEAEVRLTVASKTDAEVMVEGGPALGIYENTLLQPLRGSLRLRVKRLVGVNRALCVVEQGDAQGLQVGDALTVSQWALPERSRLRVAMPAIALSGEVLARHAADFAVRASRADIRLSEQSTAPFALLYRAGKWQLQNASGEVLAQAERLESIDIKAVNGQSLFWQLPVPQLLAETLQKSVANRQTVELVTSDADYLLACTYQASGLGYRWLREEAGPEVTPMPATSVLVAATDTDLPKVLADHLARLARIKNLLTIENPQGSSQFPYKLVLQNAETKQEHQSDTLTEGQAFGLRLRLDSAAATLWNGKGAWVYVFVLDADGNTSLLYPRSGNVENFLPPAGQRPPIIALGPERLLRITPPFGADTYVTLVTTEPLPDPFLLQQKGVQTRAEAHPLADLLLGTTKVRAGGLGNWQVYRRVFVSKARK